MISICKITLFWFFATFLVGNFAYSQVDLNINSSPANLYIQLDQNYNVIRRLRTPEMAEKNLMSATDKEPIKVFLFKVPTENLSNKRLLKSDMISAFDTAKTFSIDQKYIYVPVLETQKDTVNAFRSKYGEPAAETRAFKVLSRSTYYVEENQEGFGGFFAKFIKDIPFEKEKANRSILMNDYISKTELLKDSKFGFMPEYLKVELKDSLLSNHIVVYRSAQSILKTQPNKRVMPLHGLLGCEECVQKMASLSGLTVSEWKNQQFYPILGEFTAQSHFVWGTYFESHTQNVLLELDITTGKITKLLVRDLSDVVLDPKVRILQNKPVPKINWSKSKDISLAGTVFVDPAAPQAKDAGYNAAIYTGQSVDSHLEKGKERLKATAAFVQEYKKSVENILHMQIQLGNEEVQLLAQLQSGTNTLNTVEFQERGNRRNAMAMLVDDIYSQGLHQLTEQKSFLVAKNLTQEELFLMFKSALHKNGVAFTKEIPTIKTSVVNSKWNSRVNWAIKKVQNYIPFFKSVDHDFLDKNTLYIDGNSMEGMHIYAISKLDHSLTAVTFKSVKKFTCSDFLLKEVAE